MAKTLDFNKINRPVLQLIMPNKDKTEIKVSTPSEALVEELQAMGVDNIVTFDAHGDRDFAFSRKPGADTCLSYDELNMELIDGAKAAGLSVIAMHTGGEARRGDLSDKFITPIFEKADYAIVVTSGDEDGLMSGICASKGIPMDAIDSISKVATVLPAAFK